MQVTNVQASCSPRHCELIRNHVTPFLRQLSRRSTFTTLQRWLDDARALASPFLVSVLVGAKCDREEDREVSWAEASRWAEERGVYHTENDPVVLLTHRLISAPSSIHFFNPV